MKGRQNLIFVPSMKKNVGGDPMPFSVWHSSPPPSLQHVAFCGMPPFDTQGEMHFVKNSHITLTSPLLVL